MTTTSEANDSPGAARAAVAEGWGRVAGEWRSVGVAYLLSVVLVLPLAAAVGMALRQSLAHREAAERMLAGWDGLWHKSFAAQAQGVEATFDPGVVGIGAVLRSLDALVTATLFELPQPIVVAGLAYLAGWVLLSGGLLARFRGERGGVVGLGALHLRRLLAIAAVGWIAWALVLAGLLPALGGWIRAATIDVIDERILAAWIVAKYAVVWILVLAIRIVIDFAKVAAVDDPAITPWAALRDALRLLRRRTAAVIGVTAILGALGLLLLLAYSVVAPGAAQRNGLQIAMAFAIGQISVIVRVTMRAWTLASAQALWRNARDAVQR